MMAGMRKMPSKLTPVGSMDWVVAERAAARQLEEQDIEDFAFMARTELEWLNEHMAEVFERDQLYATDLTPLESH